MVRSTIASDLGLLQRVFTVLLRVVKIKWLHCGRMLTFLVLGKGILGCEDIRKSFLL